MMVLPKGDTFPNIHLLSLYLHWASETRVSPHRIILPKYKTTLLYKWTVDPACYSIHLLPLILSSVSDTAPACKRPVCGETGGPFDQRLAPGPGDGERKRPGRLVWDHPASAAQRAAQKNKTIATKQNSDLTGRMGEGGKYIKTNINKEEREQKFI